MFTKEGHKWLPPNTKIPVKNDQCIQHTPCFIEAHITLSRKYSIFSKISWLSTILYNSSSNYLYEITKHEKHSYIFLFIHILCVCFQFSFHFQKEVLLVSKMNGLVNPKLCYIISHRTHWRENISGLTGLIGCGRFNGIIQRSTL